MQIDQVRETLEALEIPEQQVIELNTAVECTVCGNRIPPGERMMLVMTRTRSNLAKYEMVHLDRYCLRAI